MITVLARESSCGRMRRPVTCASGHHQQLQVLMLMKMHSNTSSHKPAPERVGKPRVLESVAYEPGCTKPRIDYWFDEIGLAGEGADIVIAKMDEIHFYAPDGRGVRYAYEGPKDIVHIVKDCVALVSPPASQPSTARRSAGIVGTLRWLVRRGVAASVGDDPLDVTSFTFQGTELKFVAHPETLCSGAKRAFRTWGDILVLELDGILYRFHDVCLREHRCILC
ncbi:hypothetical protein HOY82DRAFT_613926 [Tuber indicum]|nr:hypothetical protein HOY82DRAFT_613926 [Tuber indicum]